MVGPAGRRRPTVVVADAEALPFEDASFDVVVSLRLSGHLPPATRVAVLREFRRVSRGHVIVAFYHRGSVQDASPSRARGLVEPGQSRGHRRRARSRGLRRVGPQSMLPFVSETVVVLAEPV
jgi:SAM-dependent methyltransferase